LAASQGMDLILAGMGGLYTGLAIAEKLDLPFLQAYLVPFTPTREFASVLLSKPPAWIKGSINRLSHHLTRQVIWQGFRSADNLARREVLGLPQASFWGPYPTERMRGLPILYGFSPSVIPPPADWGARIHVTGYWGLEAERDWVPAQDLVDFLDSGPPPVYIGFGSMSNRKPEETAELVSQALKEVNQRAILSSGWGGLQGKDLPDSIWMVDSIPHAWLFPRMASVVHHGGAGTTAAGVSAGVPSIIIPFFGDQPFWGRRIADLGVGPEPIPRNRLTVDRLAHAIQKSVTDQDMRQRAARLGTKIQGEDGVGRAVEVIGDPGLSFDLPVLG
jgi:sterol 3beta-glucosyltransferase